MKRFDVESGGMNERSRKKDQKATNDESLKTQGQCMKDLCMKRGCG